MIAIIDCGIGNLNSIVNMLRRVTDKEVLIVDDAEGLKKAEKIILPGVGAFDAGMKALNSSGVRDELDRQVLEFKKPIMGICLGMQMLGKKSEEGKETGLGYIDFECRKFAFEKSELKVPHMGWDYVDVNNTFNNQLLSDPLDELRFYFVHSYYAICNHRENEMLFCDYGVKFTAGVCKDNIYGVQFHPEKSHKYGKWLFKNFSERA